MSERLRLCWRVLRLPHAGLAELAQDIGDIYDFYTTTKGSRPEPTPPAHIMGTTRPTVVRPEFPIDPDDYE